MRKKIILLLLLVFVSHWAQASQLSVDYMLSSSQIQALRVGYTPWTQNLTHYQNLHDYPSLSRLNVAIELSYSSWFDNKAKSTVNHVIAITPVFTYPLYQTSQNTILFEIAVGASYLRYREFADIDLGSRFHFEDRIGIVFQLSRMQRFAIRYMHYSNGGITPHNPGMDFLSLGYSLVW